MNKNGLLTLSATALIIIGVAMIVIGIVAKILPPPLTGIGFFFIAAVFLAMRDKSEGNN